MPVLAYASRNRRNQRVAESVDDAVAFAAVIQSIFPQSFRQRVARCGGYQLDAEYGADALAVSSHALTPLRGSLACLIKSSENHCARDWIRTEGVK